MKESGLICVRSSVWVLNSSPSVNGPFRMSSTSPMVSFCIRFRETHSGWESKCFLQTITGPGPTVLLKTMADEALGRLLRRLRICRCLFFLCFWNKSHPSWPGPAVGEQGFVHAPLGKRPQTCLGPARGAKARAKDPCWCVLLSSGRVSSVPGDVPAPQTGVSQEL